MYLLGFMENKWKVPKQLKQGKYDDIIYGFAADGRVSRSAEETQKWLCGRQKEWKIKEECKNALSNKT